MLTQPNTTKHKHITQFQHRYKPISFQVARGLHKYARTVVSCMTRTCSATQGMSRSTGTLTLKQVRAMRTLREPDWTMIIVIVAEREEKRRQEREERRERRRKREREKGRKREKREPPPVHKSIPTLNTGANHSSSEHVHS